MILLLWIPIISMIVKGILLTRKAKYEDEEKAFWVTFSGGALGVIFLLVCIFQPIFSGMDVAEYTTFYETNFQNYGISVEETASLLSVEEFENQLVAGSVEKWEQAGYISERIREWRDDVNTFNLNIASYRYCSTHPLIGVLYPNLPDHIQPLTIGR